MFRPELLIRFLAKIADSNPERARRLSPLRHVLPPRPGGVLELLDTLPDADVVVVAHAGLDGFGSFRELARSVPVHDAIRVTAWRIPVADIPIDANDRITWLDEQWLQALNGLLIETVKCGVSTQWFSVACPQPHEV